MKRFLKKIIKPLYNKYNRIITEIETNRILSGKILITEMLSKNKSGELIDYEFKVFSQSGEDGIIQYLLSKVPVENDTFVEFGVEDYSESNTRFLLQNNDWKGLVIDGSLDNINTIKAGDIYWQHELTALHSFITKENINGLIKSAGISGDIGLLSVDIDGNDYWVWEAINVITPRIVICEYNSLFGAKEAVTVPYDAAFFRTNKHYSNLYFGASLKAFCLLAEKKGYIFAGCNSYGSNAFFVRKDVAGNIKANSCENGFINNRSRQSRGQNGELTYISGEERAHLIGDMEVLDITSNKLKLIKELF